MFMCFPCAKTRVFNEPWFIVPRPKYVFFNFHTFVGVFHANTDRDTEVVHRLEDAHTGSPGIVAAEFRFQPLSQREGGFRNHKAMRVGLYGSSISEEGSDDEESTEPRTGGDGRIPLQDEGVFIHMSHEIPRDENINYVVSVRASHSDAYNTLIMLL